MVVEGNFNHVLKILVKIMEHVKLMEKVMYAIVVQVSCNLSIHNSNGFFLLIQWRRKLFSVGGALYIIRYNFYGKIIFLWSSTKTGGASAPLPP